MIYGTCFSMKFISGWMNPKLNVKPLACLKRQFLCFAKKGFDQVTLEMIAREAAVTRPLLKHYFANGKDIENYALKYIRVSFQKLCVDALLKSEDPKEMLCNYIAACLYWTEHYRTHASVWMSFLHRCSRDKKNRALNTLAVKTGEDRILTLVQHGIDKGVFRCENTKGTAKMVQVLITGLVITSIAEDLDDSKEFLRSVQSQVLAILGVRRS